MNVFLLAAALITGQPIATGETLEPSVQNEVDHALARVPTNAFCCASALCRVPVTNDWFGTNGLNAAATAIKLISAQGKDGRWTVGTNDVTRVAVCILKHVSGTEPAESTEKADCESRCKTNCCKKTSCQKKSCKEKACPKAH
jgi:hypothetical protein